MKVILVGYGEMLRALALGILNSKHEIVGILRAETIRYNKAKRFIYDYLKPSNDYLFIKTHTLHEINVRSVNSKEFRHLVKELKADVVMVGSWSEKFSVQTINTIPNGFVNVHPSLLPKYRGPNPYLQAIWHNESMSGVTFHLMDVNYDTGSILHQKEVPILPDDTGGSLKMRCCDTARYEVGFLLNNFKERVLNQRSQNEQEATYQHHISIADSIINFETETSEQIDRKIRAFSPWLKCHIPIKNEFFTFEKCECTDEKLSESAGTIVDLTKDDLFIVSCDKRVMKFSGIKINRPLSKMITNLYKEKIIKINDRAV